MKLKINDVDEAPKKKASTKPRLIEEKTKVVKTAVVKIAKGAEKDIKKDIKKAEEVVKETVKEIKKKIEPRKTEVKAEAPKVVISEAEIDKSIEQLVIE